MNNAGMMRLIRSVALLPAAVTLAGCYVLHTARGQMDVMSRRQPIPAVIANPATPSAVKSQLQRVLDIREFAVRELALPDNGSYRSYVDLQRPFVVWNVFAAPEFSVEPKRWCFLVVGCVSYRGYFSERKARAFAARLARRGFDVFVGGVPAYSTLGHFDDPVLNTMIGWSDIQLAAIIFHELTHQLLYVPSDSEFDEALATVVEDEGVKRWLVRAGRETELGAYRERKQRYLQIAGLFSESRDRLRILYASGAPPETVRRRKQEIFTALRLEYQALKQSWTGNSPFDDGFFADLNNARLAAVATYQDCVPGLEALLAHAQGDLTRFYSEARELARLDLRARHSRVCRH
jgi:predicted aminopeptidase